MIVQIDREGLWKKYNLNKGLSKFSSGDKIKTLPFKTKKNEKAYKNGLVIFSMLSKMISGETFSEILTKDELLGKIVEQVDTKQKEELRAFIDGVYFDENNLEIFHPKIFNYRMNEDNDIKELANYLYNMLFDEESISMGRKVYNTKPSNIAERLILRGMPKINIMKRVNINNALNLVPEITKVFKIDFNFICSKPNFFIENVEMLIEHYMGILTMQNALKLRDAFDAKDDEFAPVYFFVDWEQASKSRIAYEQGWRMLESKTKDLFAYTNLIEILNTTVNDEKYSFTTLKSEYEKMSSEELSLFETTVYEFIEEKKMILELGNIKPHRKYKEQFNCSEALNELTALLIEAKNTGKGSAYTKYESHLKDLLKVRFLKARGSVGLTLNIRETELIFLTKLCINDQEKIRLNLLWYELEKRGIYFDKYTRIKVVEYFEKVGILEKKSDSGDAQYVRIL